MDWYESLKDDCRSIMVEAEFTATWSLVSGYHLLGQRILQDREKFNDGIEKAVQDLAHDIGKSRRTIYYAVKFAENYPRLDKVPEGKKITWNKLVTKYLTDGSPQTNDELCPTCGQRIRK